MLKRSLLAIALLVTGAAPAFAATCPEDAPEGYQWLASYVDEFRAQGTVSSWFTDSLAQFPEDNALRGLKAYFDADGDLDAARALFVSRGGGAESFAVAMACAGVE